MGLRPSKLSYLTGTLHCVRKKVVFKSRRGQKEKQCNRTYEFAFLDFNLIACLSHRGYFANIRAKLASGFLPLFVIMKVKRVTAMVWPLYFTPLCQQ